MMKKGWYQVAFTRDLKEEVNAVDIGDKKLIAINREGQWGVYDAWCPHRGAHLGFGGCIKGNKVECPFHGLMITLEDATDSEPREPTDFSVKAYKTLDLGGILFAELEAGLNCGFEELVSQLITSTCIVPGFQLQVKAPFSMVIENAFDCAHFNKVHHIVNHPDFEVCASENGEFAASGEFVVPLSQWHQNAQQSGNQSLLFKASAYSPGIVVTYMDGTDPYWVITCATPGGDGNANVYLSIAVPLKEDGAMPEPQLCKYLLQKSHEGLQPDIVIWSHMKTDHQPVFIARDRCVQGFQAFCEQFY